MYYELYIDVFFLENFMLDSLLLMAVNRVMGKRLSYDSVQQHRGRWSDEGVSD